MSSQRLEVSREVARMGITGRRLLSGGGILSDVLLLLYTFQVGRKEVRVHQDTFGIFLDAFLALASVKHGM